MPTLLIAAARLQHALTQVLRIALDEHARTGARDAGPEGAAGARAAARQDFAALEKRLADAAGARARAIIRAR